MINRDKYSSPTPLLRAVAVLLSCLVASGCGGVAKSLVEISSLYTAIVKEYGEKNVKVNLHNSALLSVTFINSPLNDKGREERAKRAEQTAAFVAQHYSSIGQIREIWVGFVRTETHFIVVHYTVSLDAFGFDKDARPLSRPEEIQARRNSAISNRPIATYSPSLKQTEVMISSLQLEGDVDYGLAVSPHFTVPGNATGVRRSPNLPSFVSLDFASYSEKSMFPGKPRITLLADGKVLFETLTEFSTSKLPDGKTSEYLLLQIPYPTFRSMTTGKNLRLRIGDREYAFTGEQVEALREMTQYLKE